MTLGIVARDQAAPELTGEIAANSTRAAEPILEVLTQVAGNQERPHQLDLSALKDVQEALPRSQFSTEQYLQAESNSR